MTSTTTLAQRYMNAVWGEALDASALEPLLHPEFESMTFSAEGCEAPTRGFDALCAKVEGVRKAMPGLSKSVVRIIADDTQAAVEVRMTATHPAAGPIEARQMHVLRFQDGAIREDYAYFDRGGLMNHIRAALAS